MKLKVMAKPNLTLTKEKKVIPYGEEFEVSDERGKEILKVLFNNVPVVEFVSSSKGSQDNTELETKVKELEEANTTLAAEKAELEAKVKELEEASATLADEQDAGENPDDQENKENKTKGKGDK